jgi:SSS family solute:Na+ symporter
MQIADYYILFVYLAAILGIGLLLGRVVKNPLDMFAAGGQSPWWVSGLSAFMTMFSAGTFVVWGGIAYRLGFVAISISMCYGIAAFFVGWTLAARWRRMGVGSAAEFLQLRYGNSIVQLYTWLQGLLQIFTLGGAVYALALVICTLIQLPPAVDDTFFVFLRDSSTGTLSVTWTSIIIIIAVIAITLSGGLWAVLITDTLQFIILTVSVVFVVPLILLEAGGVTTFLSNAASTTVDAEGSTLLSPVSGSYTYWFLLGWLIVHYAKIGGEWAFVQRFTCVPTARDARKSAILFGVMYLVSPVFWMLPAIAFRTIEPLPESFDDSLAPFVINADLSGFSQAERAQYLAGDWQLLSAGRQAELYSSSTKRFSERAYILACQAVLPAGMIGLMVAAMISATASMATTQLNVYAGAFTEQVYKRLFKSGASPGNLLLAGRWLTLLLGCLALAGALIIPRAGTYESYVIALTAALTIPLVLPTIWGLFSKRMTTVGAWTTTILGVSCSLLVKFGLQGSNAWLAGVEIFAPLHQLASQNPSVTDWVVGLTVPVTTLLLFELLYLRRNNFKGFDSVHANQVKFAEKPSGTPSALPAKIVAWFLLALALVFVPLIPSAEEGIAALVTLILVLSALGLAVLFKK